MRALFASVVGVVLCAWLGACESSAPLGEGNVIDEDVDATSQAPPQNGTADDASADSPFAPPEGPYGMPPDGYAPLAVCAQCACGAGTYCYAGSPATSLTSCDQTQSSASSLEPGCHTSPASCASTPDDCACLLAALDLTATCYAVCTPGGGEGGVEGGLVVLEVYCPTSSDIPGAGDDEAKSDVAGE